MTVGAIVSRTQAGDWNARVKKKHKDVKTRRDGTAGKLGKTGEAILASHIIPVLMLIAQPRSGLVISPTLVTNQERLLPP